MSSFIFGPGVIWGYIGLSRVKNGMFSILVEDLGGLRPSVWGFACGI